MPTQADRSRTWCSKCQDWRIHRPELSQGLLCTTCQTKFEGYRLSEIPADKLQEQRLRWKESRSRVTAGIYGAMLGGMMGGFEGSSINESSAGQKEIDDERWAKINEKIKYQKEEIEKYKGLHRNEECICGSTKKFKKCCWSRIESYK